MQVVPVVEAAAGVSGLDHEAGPRVRLASPPCATAARWIIVGEENEMFDPLGNCDQGQAIGPQRGPNRNAQPKMCGPGGLPALSKAKHGCCGSKANRSGKRTAKHQFWGIEISDWQTSARIEEQPLKSYDAGIAFHGGKQRGPEADVLATAMGNAIMIAKRGVRPG
jgi:hypothetical protein